MRSRRLTEILLVGLGLAAAAFVAFNVPVLLEFSQAWQLGYRFEWMPDGVAPYSGSQKFLSNSGHVAVDVLRHDGRTLAGRWHSSENVVRLAGTGTGTHSFAHAVNNKGHVAGLLGQTTGGVPRAVVSTEGFFWSPEAGLIELATTEFTGVLPVDLNDRDQLASNGVSRAVSVFRATLWTPKSPMRELGAMTPTGDSFANSINENGWVVGNSTAADGRRHPVLWKPGEPIQDLGLPFGFTIGYARDVNRAGEVLVELGQEATGASPENCRPFLWREEGGYEPLPYPEGYDEISTFAINNKGTILLSARSETEQGLQYTYFLLRDGELAQLPDAPREGRTSYCSLNDRGWLTGFITGADAKRTGFIARSVR